MTQQATDSTTSVATQLETGAKLTVDDLIAQGVAANRRDAGHRIQSILGYCRRHRKDLTFGCLMGPNGLCIYQRLDTPTECQSYSRRRLALAKGKVATTGKDIKHAGQGLTGKQRRAFDESLRAPIAELVAAISMIDVNAVLAFTLTYLTSGDPAIVAQLSQRFQQRRLGEAKHDGSD